MTNLSLKLDDIFDGIDSPSPEFKVVDENVCQGVMSQDEYLLFKNNAVRINAAESGAD